jgi:pyrimidine-nucleoside phosphorylase
MSATRGGYVEQLSALQVGLASIDLGAGRERKDDDIDHAVGIIVHKNVGDAVEKGEPIFTLHANDSARLEQARQRLDNAIVYGNHPTAPLPTFYDVIGS